MLKLWRRRVCWHSVAVWRSSYVLQGEYTVIYSFRRDLIKRTRFLLHESTGLSGIRFYQSSFSDSVSRALSVRTPYMPDLSGLVIQTDY